MPPFRVGLTGGLASGKSTVAKLLAEAGFQVVDADEIVAELYAPGQPGARAVAEMFGANYLDRGGAVDKPRLARLVFSDDAARAARSKRRSTPLFELLSRASRPRAATPIVLEATRLVEAGYRSRLRSRRDRRSRIRRFASSAPSPAVCAREEALRRLAAQGDGSERRAAAHRVIDNNGTAEELRAQVEALVAEIRPR